MGSVEYLNPEGLHANPAFTNVIVVSGAARTVYIGGQDAVDATGTIIGKSDIKAQTEQVMRNLEIALAAGGASLDHVIIWRIYVVQGHDIRPAFEVAQRVWGNRPHPPAITFAYVAGLGSPDFLVELEAIAVVP